MRRPRSALSAIAAALTAALSLTGCLRPISPDRAADPALDDILSAYERTIDAAHADPNATWHAGWLGNNLVAWRGDDHYGLCWHWQTITYTGVRGAVRQHGWRVGGIGARLGTQLEHHAVLLVDPQTADYDAVADGRSDGPAYVLDPWIRGRADVYAAAAWIRRMKGATREPVFTPATFEGGGSGPPRTSTR